MPRNTKAGALRTRDAVVYHSLASWGASKLAAEMPGRCGIVGSAAGHPGGATRRGSGEPVEDRSDHAATWASTTHEGDDPLVEARLIAVTARLGRPLDAAEEADVRRQLADSVATARKLRHVPLSNADEPATTFLPVAAGVARDRR